MLISLNWIKKYVNIPISDEELIRLIGARLVEVEGVTDETNKYNNIYIVKVASVEKIPETHLTLCKIDVGEAEISGVEKDEKGLVQVVCGAPNVREGMLAVWIAPGAVVPASVHEDSPFVIGKRKMLNKYESYGMLAGADELDFGDDHSGIVEIEPGVAEPGNLLKDIYELDDKILEIENKSLTHRPDTFGIIGFSREVAGILGESYEYEYQDTELKPYGDINIKVENEKICPRYTAIVLEKHGEIKKKYLSTMDILLSKSGMKPVSPIVDVTNYLMLLTGQPLHAFDYDKFVNVGGKEKPEIYVRLAREGEKLELLDDTLVELNASDIVICSGDTPVALAGAMGGKSTMVDENTRNVILESATFSLYNLRKTQMAHGIFSEAITRYTKGQPGYQCLRVAEAAAEMLKEGFKVSAVADTLEKEATPEMIDVRISEINGLLGTEYDTDFITETLNNVGFQIRASEEEISILVPEWRTDIHIKEDIIEEVGRLTGYDNISPVLVRHGTAEKNALWELKKKVRRILSQLGANEVLTYSFVSGRLLEKAGMDVKKSYKITNSLSPELQYVRQSIVPSLLDKAYVNQKLPVDKFAIYEINKVYSKEFEIGEKGDKDVISDAAQLEANGVPREMMKLGFVLAERKTEGTPYYKAKMYAEEVLKLLNIKAEIRPICDLSRNGDFDKNDEINNDFAVKYDFLDGAPFEKRRSGAITINGDIIGIVGEFKNSVKRNFKLNEYVAGFEMDFLKLLEYTENTPEINLRQVVEKRDVTIETVKSYAEIIESVKKILKDYEILAKITPLAIYQPENIKYVSLHFEFYDEINDEIMAKLEGIG